jgi:ligand-binding sensor domain-containing protein
MTRRIVTCLLVCFSSLACVMGMVQQENITPVAPTAQVTGTAAPPSPPTWTIYTSGNDVNDMAFDNEGNLWAATSGGLVKWMMDGTYIKYTTLDGLPDNDIRDVATASDGTVWLGSLESGLTHFDPSALGGTPASGRGEEAWTTYTIADGLPDNRVWDIALAPDGTVWISTYERGVTHFVPPAEPGHGGGAPGGAWTTYTTADGLSSNDAYSIATTKDGIVWATTRGCDISRLDPAASGGTPVTERDGAKWTPYTIDNDAYNCPSTIAVAPDGTVWAPISDGLAHFDSVDWQTYANDSLGNIYAIAVADDGSVWGTDQYNIFHFEEGAPDGGVPNGAWTTYSIAQTDGLLLRSIAIAPDGSIWVSRHIPHEKSLAWIGLGVARFDPAASRGTVADEAWILYATDDDLTANRVDYTVQTADGMLWFFTEGGPSCHSGKEWVPCPSVDQGVPIGPSATLAPDGTLWSLNLSSVIRFDPGGESWIVYDNFPGSSLGNLTIAPDGSVWVSTHMYPSRTVPQGYGVARFDGTSWQVYTTTHGLADDFVNDIAVAADGALWFATRAGASRFDGEIWTAYDVNTVLPTNDLPYNEIRRVITTPGGLVCCELTGAVSCFDGKSWMAYTEADGLYMKEDIGLNIILSTAVDQDGALWLGTNEGGVSRFDGATWTTYTTADGLPDNQINTIAVAPDGAIWVGTLGGASRFDPSAGPGHGGETWVTYTTAHGLADNIVQTIIVDQDGALWFSTYSGISRYGPPQ